MVSFVPELVVIIAAFFLVGVFVVILGFIELFFSGGSGALHATHLPKPSSQVFLRALSHMTDFSRGRGGDITVFEEGNEFLEALLEDIKKAKKSVNITAYVWEAGNTTERVTEVLSKKAREGVPVRLLLDGVGGFSRVRDQIIKLRGVGVQVKYFRGVRPDKLMRLHRRTHRRAMIMDGRVGYTGGYAFADYWYEETRYGNPWRDLMFRVNDLPAQALQTAFSELWLNAAGEMLVGEAYYPKKNKPVSNEQETKESQISLYQKHNGVEKPFLHLASSPSMDVHPFSKFLWFSVACAKKRVYAITPYFVPNKSLHNVLKERAQEGVDVRLLLPNEKNMDRNFVRWAANSYYWDLLEAGVRIYEYDPAMIHTKLLLVDDCWSVFGSGNIDFRSFELNEENVFGVQDEELNMHLAKIFEKDLGNATEILLSEWKKRGWWARIRERAVLLFAAQF